MVWCGLVCDLLSCSSPATTEPRGNSTGTYWQRRAVNRCDSVNHWLDGRTVVSLLTFRAIEAARRALSRHDSVLSRNNLCSNACCGPSPTGTMVTGSRHHAHLEQSAPRGLIVGTARGPAPYHYSCAAAPSNCFFCSPGVLIRSPSDLRKSQDCWPHLCGVFLGRTETDLAFPGTYCYPEIDPFCPAVRASCRAHQFVDQTFSRNSQDQSTVRNCETLLIRAPRCTGAFG